MPAFSLGCTFNLDRTIAVFRGTRARGEKSMGSVFLHDCINNNDSSGNIGGFESSCGAASILTKFHLWSSSLLYSVTIWFGG